MLCVPVYRELIVITVNTCVIVSCAYTFNHDQLTRLKWVTDFHCWWVYIYQHAHSTCMFKCEGGSTQATIVQAVYTVKSTTQSEWNVLFRYFIRHCNLIARDSIVLSPSPAYSLYNTVWSLAAEGADKYLVNRTSPLTIVDTRALHNATSFTSKLVERDVNL